VRKQLPNAAATWLNTHKDALMPTDAELDDLPESDEFDSEGYKLVPRSLDD